MSYQIVEENRKSCLFGDLLVLAVINNIAVCAAQSLELKTSRRWFDFLGRVLEAATSDDGILATLEEDDYLFFSLNVLLHQDIVLIASPAA